MIGTLFLGQSARLLRKRTCRGYNLGNFKLWQAAPETLESKLPKGKGCFGRQSQPTLVSTQHNYLQYGSCEGKQTGHTGHLRSYLDTCKQPVSLLEHTRFLPGPVCSEYKLGLPSVSQTAPRLQETTFPKGKRLLLEAGPPILVHSKHESLQ